MRILFTTNTLSAVGDIIQRLEICSFLVELLFYRPEIWRRIGSRDSGGNS
jgi:hypothetical protein